MRKRIGLFIALVGALSLAFGAVSLSMQRGLDDDDVRALRAKRLALRAVLGGIALAAVGGYLCQRRLWIYGDPKSQCDNAA